MPRSLPTKADLQRMTAQLADVVTNPKFTAAVEELQQLPPDERLAAFDRIASTNALRARGLEFPDDLRTSPRYFERPSSRGMDPADPGAAYWVRPMLEQHGRAIAANESVAPLDLGLALEPLTSSSLAGGQSVAGISVCVSGGMGICVSIGYAQ